MPRYSLKVLLLVITVAAAMAAFYHIRSQPRIVAERFQSLIEQGNHEPALKMIDLSTLYEKRKLEPYERLELKLFTHADPTPIEWLQGKRKASLDIFIFGTSETISVWIPVHCDAVVTSTGIHISRIEESDPLVGILVGPDE